MTWGYAKGCQTTPEGFYVMMRGDNNTSANINLPVVLHQKAVNGNILSLEANGGCHL